jgi:hypothetical protein
MHGKTTLKKITGDSFDASFGLLSTVILWSLFINHSPMGMEKNASCRKDLNPSS